MRCMFLEHIAPIETSPLRLADIPDPAPAAGEVRVKVRCCAVCRTDLHVVEGDLPKAKLPVIPGHQIVGTVDQLGPGSTRFKLGQRIGIAWLRHTDGTCRYCTAGRENLCPNSRYTGYQADGGYAQYAVVPEDYAYEIPAVFSDTQAAPLLCAGIIGYRALRRANLPPGGPLALFGFGSSAHIVFQIARHRGSPVYVITRAANHQKLALDMGAAWAGPDTSGIPTRVDSAIMFAPAGQLVPPALLILNRGGTLSLAGIHMSPIPSIDYDTHLYGERDIHPVTANTRDDGRALLAEAAAANLHMHTTLYELKDANRALQDMKSDRLSGTAVLTVSP